jgi:hypothetical protein
VGFRVFGWEKLILMRKEIMNHQRIFCFASILTVCIVAGTKAGGIEVQSEKHRVWGRSFGSLISDSYDITNNSPINGSAAALWWGEHYSEENPGTNRVFSSAGNFGVSAADQSCWTFTGSYAKAKSDYIFKPMTSQLEIAFTGGVQMHAFENWVSFILYDITNEFQLDSNVWKTEGYGYIGAGLSGPIINEVRNYSVSPLHQYRLELYAQVDIGDTPGVTSHLQTAITPEPASLLLLALGGLWIRKRPIK